MARIQIKVEDLPAALTKHRKSIEGAIKTGLATSAHKARSRLVMKTPVDTGRMKNAWKVRKRQGTKRFPNYEVTNDAPYAGIIEKGARPHGVSKEGQASIRLWVRRHFPAADEKEVDGITMGIVMKLMKKGQKPTHFVKNQLKHIENDLYEEINRALASSRAVKGGGINK